MKRDQRKVTGLTGQLVISSRNNPHLKQRYSTFYLTSLGVMRDCKIPTLYFGKRRLMASVACLPVTACKSLDRAVKRDLPKDKEGLLCPSLSSRQQQQQIDENHRRFSVIALYSLKPISPLVGLVLQLHSSLHPVIILNLCRYHCTPGFIHRVSKMVS